MTNGIPKSVNPARLIMPALRSDALSGFAHEAGRIADTLEIGVGGYIIFGGTAESVRRLTADLLRRAGRPLLLASDLERGAGQQIAGLTEFPPPMALASLRDPAVIRWAAAVTAQEARAVGINWVFAPVADLDLLPENPIVQTRAFGADPNEVATYVRQWVEGCQGAGALACAKHYPGHGRTAVDSHVALPVVEASATALRATDLVPFTVAIASGVASIMTAHVAYPTLDSSGLPATLSRTLLGRATQQLRRAGGHRRAHHGWSSGWPPGVRCRGRGNPGRSGPAALSQRCPAGARRARGGAVERGAADRTGSTIPSAATTMPLPPLRRRRLRSPGGPTSPPMRWPTCC